jgi:hypothetical protein
MAETTSSSAAGQARQELTLSRIYGAPRSIVFKAWTDPKHVARWWGPQAAAALSGMEQGWSESLYRLGDEVDNISRSASADRRSDSVRS